MKTSTTSPRRLRPWLILCAVVVLLSGAGGAVWYRQAQTRLEVQRSVETAATVMVQDVGVGALGRLEPGWRVLAIAPATSIEGSRILSLMVEEGSEVERGTVLAILDNQRQREAALQEARAQLRVSEARLALVRAGTKVEELAAQEATIDQLKASLRRTEADLKRVDSIRTNGAISAEEYDLRLSQVQVARANLRQAESMLNSMKRVRPEDIAVAEAEVMKAQAGVVRSETDLELSNVRAPITGRILKIHTYPGEKVGEMGLLDLGDTRSMHAVAEVYERDVPKVRIGQSVTVYVQSIPGELKGEVVHVGWKVGRRDVLDNDPIKDTDARVVEVRVKLDPASSQRVAGLSYARIEVRIDTVGAN